MKKSIKNNLLNPQQVNVIVNPLVLNIYPTCTQIASEYRQNVWIANYIIYLALVQTKAPTVDQ